MNAKEKEFQKKLLMTFQVEAEEHLKALSSGLLNLEKPDNETISVIIESVFREVHSLKGAARAVNLRTIEKICQSLESVFSAMKKNELEPLPFMFDIFHNAVNQLSELLLVSDSEINNNVIKNIDNIINQVGGTLKSPEKEIRTKKKIGDLSQEDEKEVTSPGSQVSDFQIDTSNLRISAEKLNSLMLQAQELQSKIGGPIG